MAKKDIEKIDWNKYINKDGTINLIDFYYDEFYWNKKRMFDSLLFSGKKVRYKSWFNDFKKWLTKNERTPTTQIK